MTVVNIGNGILLAVSTDTKPTTYPTNTLLYEQDSSTWWQWDGAVWTSKRNLRDPTIRKYGWIYGVSSTLGGVGGLFANYTAATGNGTNSNQFDNTYGAGIRYVSGATSGNNAGFRVNRAITIRGLNFRLSCAFKIAQTGTDFRYYIGLTTGTGADPTGDDPLNALSGYMFGLITTNANWVIMKNSGSGAGTYTSAGLAAPNANIHTLTIQADDANSRIGWSFDGGAFTYDTTLIPAQTTQLTVTAETQTNTAAARNHELYYMILET
jgi:hypothetical protein